jgi:hypothetical protein
MKMAKKEQKQLKLRVWWVPQVPGKPFIVEVKDVEQAKFVMNMLADYDLFQYKNRIKPDYANAGGFQEFHEGTGTWEEWSDNKGRDINEILLEERG